MATIPSDGSICPRCVPRCAVCLDVLDIVQDKWTIRERVSEGTRWTRLDSALLLTRVNVIRGERLDLELYPAEVKDRGC